MPLVGSSNFTILQFPQHSRRTKDIYASFCLDGPVLSWYQWMVYNNQFTSWNNFLQALQFRFGPPQFDDPQGALVKLTQTSTV